MAGAEPDGQSDVTEQDTESSASNAEGPQPVEPRWMLVRLLLAQGAEHTMIMEVARARELADRKSERTAGGGKGEGRRVDVVGLAKDHTSVRVVCSIDDLVAVILVEMAARPEGAPTGQES